MMSEPNPWPNTNDDEELLSGATESPEEVVKFYTDASYKTKNGKEASAAAYYIDDVNKFACLIEMLAPKDLNILRAEHNFLHYCGGRVYGIRHNSTWGECIAVIAALEKNYPKCRDKFVVVYTDCASTIIAMEKLNRRENLPEKDINSSYHVLHRLAHEFAKGVTFIHINGHSGVYENEMADAMAKQAVLVALGMDKGKMRVPKNDDYLKKNKLNTSRKEPPLPMKVHVGPGGADDKNIKNALIIIYVTILIIIISIIMNKATTNKVPNSFNDFSHNNLVNYNLNPKFV